MYNDPSGFLTLGQMTTVALLALLSSKDRATVPHFRAAV